MKKKRSQPRVFWIMESEYAPIVFYSKKEAMRDLKIMNDEYWDAKAKLIKVQEVPCRKKK